MPTAATLPPFQAIIVAAGEGVRAAQQLPKQFAPYRGKPLLRHSVEAFGRCGAKPIVIVHPPGAEEFARSAAGEDKNEHLFFVTGGQTRQQSVRNGLHALDASSCQAVLIHDAARPGVTVQIISGLLEALANSRGAIPVLPVTDSLVRGQGNLMASVVDRSNLFRVQTPQAFYLPAIRAAHDQWVGASDATDDAQVLQAAGGDVALIVGNERLKKVTFSEDFTPALPPFRVGTGFDVHRLVPGEELWLGGVRIDFDRGLAGHSDADVALHALTDALLGALGEGDIGTHFPPSDPQWKDASSGAFLRHAAGLVADHGYAVGNVDLTLICEAPKIGSHRAAMRSAIAGLLNIDATVVSIKATTTERLGFTGREEGIAAQAVATVMKTA